MAKTKITVMILAKLFQHFDRQMNKLHIKRDAFLDSMIKGDYEFAMHTRAQRRRSADL